MVLRKLCCYIIISLVPNSNIDECYHMENSINKIEELGNLIKRMVFSSIDKKLEIFL